MDVKSRQYNLDEAFSYCAAVTQAHYENYPVASFFLPQEKRPYIQAIYAFSRIADDYADEQNISKDERLTKLNDWEEKLRQCYDGNADHPVFIALKDTIKKNDIPIDPLKDLLTAFKRDVIQNRFDTFEDLLSYCKCSANPVGRLVLMIFNYRDEKLFELSDCICTALQLTNFWQDVRVDREKDRLYIPIEDMRKYEYKLQDWNNGVINEGFRKLLRFEVERTREMFYKGAELPSLVAKDLQLELKLIWFGGMEILRMIDKNRCDVINSRPRLEAFSKFQIFLRGLIFNDLSNYKKKRKRKEPWDLT
jgi:squalene synthase HpnC